MSACQPELQALVGRSRGGDASTQSPGDGGRRAGVDAGDDAGVADGSAAMGGAHDGGATDAALSDGAGSAPASLTVDAARFVDAAAMPTDAEPSDAARASAQAWPLHEATEHDAGVSVSVGAATPVVVDGDIAEWPRQRWARLSHLFVFAESGSVSPEFSAACAWQRVGDDLFLAVVVRDDVHDNTHGGFDIWKGDSLQVAFDVGQERLPYDWEYGVALLFDAVGVHRWLSSDAELGEKFPAAVARWGDVTVYELRFEPARLGLNSFEDAAVRASIAVNESDGDERTVALELAPGIVEPSKSKSRFVTLSW